MLTQLPLLNDVHFHARDFTQTDKGTFKSESQAAIASGFGAVLCMPNTDPPIVSLEQLIKATELAEANAYCDIGFNFGTRGDNLGELERAYPWVRALKLYLNPTTGNLLLEDPEKVRQVFKAWPGQKPIMVHAEEPEKIRFVVELAEAHGKRLHVCHVALAEQVEEIRRAKRDGANISAEVCPHHLVFTQYEVRFLGSYGLMKPPLSSMSHKEALWHAIEDGTIDIIATDHAPHTLAEKASDNPPFGVIGEPAFSVVWQEFWHRGWPVNRLIELMFANPSTIFGITPDPDSFMKVDLEEDFTFENSMVVSKAQASPYAGRKVLGRIHSVVLHGVEVVHEGQILAAPHGRLI